MGRKIIFNDKDSIRWYSGKSVHIENTWVRATQDRIGIVRHGDSSEDIDVQSSKLENDGEEKYRSETSITKLRRQTWENWIRCSGQESKGTHRCWRMRRYRWPVEWKRPVSARRPMQFRAWEQRSCAKNQNTMPPRLLSQLLNEDEVCRGREASEAKVTISPFFDNRADIVWKVPARERLVIIGIRLSANSIKMKRVVRLETYVCFLTMRLTNNQTRSQRKAAIHKKRSESDDNNVKTVSQLGFVSQDSDALVSQGWKQSRWNPMPKVLEPIQRVRFT